MVWFSLDGLDHSVFKELDLLFPAAGFSVVWILLYRRINTSKVGSRGLRRNRNDTSEGCELLRRKAYAT